ncbi:hypothetical protein N7501_000795 [Penicillium viridicatum]|nr:hypothetical protein N7501_000795 [Penicillium viridicatum]
MLIAASPKKGKKEEKREKLKKKGLCYDRMGCWAGVAAFPLHCKRCSWIGEKKQETRNRKQEDKKGLTVSVSLVCIVEGAQKGREKENIPTYRQTRYLPIVPPLILRTYLGGPRDQI